MEASGTAPELWTNEAGKTSPDAINCQARNCYTPKVARCTGLADRPARASACHLSGATRRPVERGRTLFCPRAQGSSGSRCAAIAPLTIRALEDHLAI